MNQKPKFSRLYHYYFDLIGNGFLAVPMPELLRLRIASFISPYSKMRGGIVYLEKDCDLPIFIQARAEHLPPYLILDRNDGNLTPVADFADFEYFPTYADTVEALS